MLTGLLLIAVAATASISSSPRGAGAPPAALLQLDESATQVFVAADKGDWDKATARLDQVERSLDDVPGSIGPGDLRGQLHRRVSALRRGVEGRQRVVVMRAANDVTRLAIELEGSFQTVVPPELKLLDYYGRQIQVGIAARRPTIVRRATADIRQRWNAIRPQVEHLGRIDEARHFTDIVVALQRTRGSADAAPLAREELLVVDQLERAFGG